MKMVFSAEANATACTSEIGETEKECEAMSCVRSLPAGGLLMVEQPYLCVEGRIFRHEDQVIDGVESEANGVKRFVYRKRKWKSHLCFLVA